MITTEIIRKNLSNVLEDTACSRLGKRVAGKVRDSYIPGDGRRVLVTTDRISAFDRVLGTIPYKGQILNQMAAYWFKKTEDILPNHVLAVPDPNIMVVRECEQLPLEFVVRGYLTGVTKTSAWYNYSNGVRDLCGNRLPDGMRKDQKLDCPILTPTTKHEKHDRPVSRAEALAEGLIDAKTFDRAAELCFRLFDRGVALAAERGLILVDTKYELGLIDGQFVLSDEVHTPDSSRYWYLDEYERRFAAGQDQKKVDKEYVREWLAGCGFRGDGEPPALSEEVRVEAARRYMEAYELITGLEFEPPKGDIRARVAGALERI